MPALTRAEAEERARILDIRCYSVDLDLTRGSEVFGSATTVRFGCTEPGSSTFVEIKPQVLHRARLNGCPLDPVALQGNRLPLAGLERDNELVVEADMPYSRTGEGMHRFTDPADGRVYVHAQCAPDDAQRLFAAFDQPDLKAVYELSVTAPEGWTVLANSVGEEKQPGRWEFSATAPMSSYLATVAAGPYHSVTAEHDGIPLGLHCRRSLARHLDEDAAELLDLTSRCFDRYHEIFDERYPFGSYDQVFVPELNFAAMENPGCVTFRDDFLFRSAVTDTQREERAIVIAHEMAHMWFGNLVTMRWWDDLWLNESFAEYMGHQVISEATAHTGAWTSFAVRRKTWGYDADQRPSTHPVAPRTLDDTAQALPHFDGISYAKGASALKQLVAWLGPEAFLAGVNEHLARHAYGNATLVDLLDTLSQAGGRDVHDWAARWLRATGVDTLSLDGGAPGRQHRIAVGHYTMSRDGRLTLRRRTETEIGPTSSQGSRAVGALSLPEPRPDLVLLNDLDLSYAKVRLDPASWQAVTESLGTVEEGISRAVLWTAARDMVRDGDLPPADYLHLVARHLPGETEVAVVESVLDFACRDIADRYLPPTDRVEALSVLSGACRKILRRTEDGSHAGLRLAAVRGLIDCAHGPRATAELTDWLAGETVPGGPELDPELRWKALLRLCAHGEADHRRINTELERDPTASGQQGAARCRAALPDQDAKDTAWQALFHRDELSNQLLTATAQGFWQPEQTELLRPYVPRYFTEAAGAATRRGPAVGTVLGRHAFPRTFAEAETLHLGEESLSAGGSPPALRRWVSDQLDDLRRAVRVRQRNAEVRAAAG